MKTKISESRNVSLQLYDAAFSFNHGPDITGRKGKYLFDLKIDDKGVLSSIRNNKEIIYPKDESAEGHKRLFGVFNMEKYKAVKNIDHIGALLREFSDYNLNREISFADRSDSMCFFSSRKPLKSFDNRLSLRQFIKISSYIEFYLKIDSYLFSINKENGSSYYSLEGKIISINSLTTKK